MGEKEAKPIRTGTAEQAALVAMLHRGGLWAKERGCWVWENASLTARVMDSLVRKKLATVQEQDVRYMLTAAGLELAATLLRGDFETFTPPRRNPSVHLPRQGSYRPVAGRRGRGV